MNVLPKYVLCNEEKEKAEEIFHYLFIKDRELKRFDDGGQGVMHGVDFFICKTIN